MVRRSILGGDADGLDRVNRFERRLHLRPALLAQQDLASGAHVGNAGERFAGVDRAKDVDARDHRAEVVGRPPHEGEQAPRREREHASATVQDVLFGMAAEADPALDPPLDPEQLHLGERAGHGAPSGLERSR